MLATWTALSRRAVSPAAAFSVLPLSIPPQVQFGPGRFETPRTFMGPLGLFGTAMIYLGSLTLICDPWDFFAMMLYPRWKPLKPRFLGLMALSEPILSGTYFVSYFRRLAHMKIGHNT